MSSKSLFVLVFCFAAMGAPAPVRAEPLRLGISDSSPGRVSLAMTDFLAALRDRGLDIGLVVAKPSVDLLASDVLDGKVHVVFETAYSALTLMDAAGMRPVLVREKGGVAAYNSVLFVRQDSDVKTLEQLRGKVVAFEHRESTSSYFLPFNLLRAAGLELVESRRALEGKVAYYFSGGDRNTVAQVRANRPADAGGIQRAKLPDNGQFRTLLPESPMVPRSVVLVAPGVDEGPLVDHLLALSSDPAAAAALKKAEKTSGFQRFDGDPTEIMNGPVRSALGL